MPASSLIRVTDPAALRAGGDSRHLLVVCAREADWERAENFAGSLSVP